MFVTSTLTSLQMFKYLVFKGFTDILKIFNDAQAEDPAVVKVLLRKANEKAAPVWNDQTTPFAVRAEQCRAILSPVLMLNDIGGEKVKFLRIDPSIAARLDRIFKKYYGEDDKLLLIGRTHEEAYEVQDKYARRVAQYLGETNQRFESRAITCLGKMYGRNSVPLLTIGSVWGLWRICQSSFHRKVVSLVSEFCPACQLPC
jgi:hypothetical protein